MPDSPAAGPALPAILCGPVLRHVSLSEFTLWLVTPTPVSLQLQLFDAGGTALLDRRLGQQEHQCVQAGNHCWIHLVHVQLEQPLQDNSRIQYDLLLHGPSACPGLRELIPSLCYGEQPRPGFYARSALDNLLHGSCRKPHHPSGDGLLQVDEILRGAQTDAAAHPDMLLLSGDQIYADDVAGPTLSAIHQVIERLGLFDEQWQGTLVNDSQELFASPHCYYEREALLPANKNSQRLLKLFFQGATKPIFTAATAHNHLITLAEVIAMYLLVWSPECWGLVDLDRGLSRVPAQWHARYRQEREAINGFVAGLDRVRRALAHVPVYMIFDDHDITDDWNLSREWEEAAYSNPFSRRIIGNALTGYWLCQGWGNQPQGFDELVHHLPRHFNGAGIQEHDRLVQRLLDWKRWHFQLDTCPRVIVLDTRTHRWRSESSPSRPSGLMDWETLTDLQQQLIGIESVILVSPPPVFGVKLIEAVQRVFSFLGKALLVDAENWMAHPGAANVILNIFRHPDTPPRFIILSGDVHYSFVYDITLRFRKHSPQIVQITASGIKNCFPGKLLRWFDRGNRFLYASRSPLNWFTKRRRMQIERRQPSRGELSALYNHSGIGQVLLREGGRQVVARIIDSAGRQVEFRPGAAPEP